MTEGIKWQRNMWKNFFRLLLHNTFRKSNCQISYQRTRGLNAARWRLKGTAHKRSIRYRNSATNDQMHSNRYLLINFGFHCIGKKMITDNAITDPIIYAHAIILAHHSFEVWIWQLFSFNFLSGVWASIAITGNSIPEIIRSNYFIIISWRCWRTMTPSFLRKWTIIWIERRSK